MAARISVRISGLLDICAVASTGFRGEAKGTTERMRRCVASSGVGNSSPAALAASASSTPKPPEAVSSTVRLPRGSRSPSTAAAWPRSSSASTLGTRTAPARRNTASKTASDPASAPVCDAAAAWPASVAPIFSTITGLPARLAASRAATSRGASRQVSSTQRMTLVAASPASQAMASAMSTSHSLPVVMKRLTPMPRSRASSIA